MDELINMLTTGANNKTILTIDEPSRSINYAGELILGVECDKQAERIYFHIPRTIIMGNTTPVDLKGSNIEIYVNFENALGNTYRTQCVDKPVIKDSTDIDDGTTPLEFSWVISNEVTAARGTVKFSICVEVLNDGKEITNEWYTIPFEGKILKGVYVSDTTNEVIIHPQASMALLMSRVAEFESFLDDYAGYTKSETEAKFTALESKYALQETVNKIISPTSTGTNGQLLKSNGYGAKPTWVTLNSDMVAIDSSIGNGLVSGSLNLSNHLKAIYEALDQAPTHDDIADAVKQVAIGDLNITSGDISHNGSDLNQYLTTLYDNLDGRVKTSFCDVKLDQNTIKFTKDDTTETWISLTSMNVKHGTKWLGSIVDTITNYANDSFCEAEANGGSIIFKTNGGSTSQLPLNLTSNHISHGGESLNSVINVLQKANWKPCSNLDSIKDCSGYYIVNYKHSNGDIHSYFGYVNININYTSDSYLRGRIYFTKNDNSETYTEHEELLRVSVEVDEYGVSDVTVILYDKVNGSLNNGVVVSNKLNSNAEDLVFQGVWRLDI